MFVNFLHIVIVNGQSVCLHFKEINISKHIYRYLNFSQRRSFRTLCPRNLGQMIPENKLITHIMSPTMYYIS